MGEGAPGDRSGDDLIARLARWEDSGAHWRVSELGDDHARVDLCACTGERVDVLEIHDPAALAALRGVVTAAADEEGPSAFS